MKIKKRGRNVINIGQLEERVILFAKEKSLSMEVRAWLRKNFLRWIINHFPYVQVVKSEERYSSLVQGRIPSWFKPREEDVEFIYVDVGHAKFKETLDRCTEFLSSRNKNMVHKFPRMTVPQVLKKWQEEHERFACRRKVYKETTGKGLIFIGSFDNLHVLKFDSKHQELSLEMARESALMQHCLGEFDDDVLGEGGYGEYYLNCVQREEIEIYSLRDAQNMPHVTIALYKEAEQLLLDQVKGKQNTSPVERYVPACMEFFNFMKVEYAYHPDTLGMGLVCIDGVSRRMEEVEDEATQQLLVTYDAEFIHKLPNPSKATKWLAILRKPSIVEHCNEPSDAMKVTALLQQTMLILKLKFTLDTTAKEISKSIQKYEIKGRVFRFLKLKVGRI